MMHTPYPLAIVTGASRGLGLELARQLIARGTHVLAIARHTNASLDDDARGAGLPLTQWALDLAHATGAAARLEAWLHGLDGRAITNTALIHNAGLIGTVGALERASPETIAAVTRVNLEAPLALTAAFLRATASWPGARRIIAISSGAGRNPVPAWPAYCASKAGLDMFARVTALDESMKPNGARIVSLAPGVIDTDMQGELRAAEAADFPGKQRFVDLYAQGQLASAADVARQVIAFLDRPDFGAVPVADVRNPPPLST